MNYYENRVCATAVTTYLKGLHSLLYNNFWIFHRIRPSTREGFSYVIVEGIPTSHLPIIGDEMYIKEDLVYSKSTGELVGFRDIGDINEYLLKLEHDVYGSQSNEERLATTMMDSW